GEEPGWRGFALPQLQAKHTPLVASLILAPVWAFWHLPLFGTEFPWPIVPPFVLSVFGGTCVLTWVFNGAKGSVLLTMLFHATLTPVIAGLVFPLLPGATLVTLWWFYSFVWLCPGLGLLSLNTTRTCPAKRLARECERYRAPPRPSTRSMAGMRRRVRCTVL